MKKLTFCLLLFALASLLSLAASASDGGTSSNDVTLIAILVGVITGLLAAGLSLFFMVRAMSTVRKKKNADEYVADGSFRLTESRDVFLYSRVSRVRVNTSNNRRN